MRRALAPLDPDLVATLFTGFLALFGIKPESGNVHLCGSPLYHTAVLTFVTCSLHMGHAVVLRAMQLGLGPRMYHHEEGRPGWLTSNVTRPVMLQDLCDVVLPPEGHNGWTINDREFLTECLYFNLQANRKYEADSGEHDDQVMMWAIAEQMRQFVPRRTGIREVEW